ncbi:SYT12 [Cordylochernes scorpioides]|uniref:SYT12 n=1 Tax=Cordylochernes scorpioides TaxID=51811 RepID=A0ABY6L5Z3_9ARAC|nr:SYT12 [Cordylochernes scorpioides]
MSLQSVGDILFSLSYLPTAERLTVVVVKARNLSWHDDKDSAAWFSRRKRKRFRVVQYSAQPTVVDVGREKKTRHVDVTQCVVDPFVKVYLLQKEKKVSKKKTSVRRGERNPIFNEAMIFSVPASSLQGTMTAQRYVDDVLRPVTLPYLQGVPNALYQQDNARPHTARISQQALQDVQMLPWPPYSPDLSPIEHVWDIIGRRLHALPQPRSEDELWQMEPNSENFGYADDLTSTPQSSLFIPCPGYLAVVALHPLSGVRRSRRSSSFVRSTPQSLLFILRPEYPAVVDLHPMSGVRRSRRSSSHVRGTSQSSLFIPCPEYPAVVDLHPLSGVRRSRRSLSHVRSTPQSSIFIPCPEYAAVVALHPMSGVPRSRRSSSLVRSTPQSSLFIPCPEYPAVVDLHPLSGVRRSRRSSSHVRSTPQSSIFIPCPEYAAVVALHPMSGVPRSHRSSSHVRSTPQSSLFIPCPEYPAVIDLHPLSGVRRSRRSSSHVRSTPQSSFFISCPEYAAVVALHPMSGVPRSRRSSSLVRSTPQSSIFIPCPEYAAVVALHPMSGVPRSRRSSSHVRSTPQSSFFISCPEYAAVVALHPMSGVPRSRRSSSHVRSTPQSSFFISCPEYAAVVALHPMSGVPRSRRSSSPERSTPQSSFFIPCPEYPAVVAHHPLSGVPRSRRSSSHVRSTPQSSLFIPCPEYAAVVAFHPLSGVPRSRRSSSLVRSTPQSSLFIPCPEYPAVVALHPLPGVCRSPRSSSFVRNTQGLLRVGGRLKYSYLNENQKFPLLQPKPPRQESLIKNLLTENADIPEAIDENQEDSSILETTFVIEDEESNKDIGTPKIEFSEVSVIDKSEGKYSKEPVVSVEALDKKELCHDDPAHLNVVEADLNRPKEATSGIINISTEANESSSKEKVVPVEIVDTSTKDYLQSGEKAKLSRWKPIDSLCLEDVKESEDGDENYSSSAYIEWPEILKKEVLRPEALEKAVNLEDSEKAAESRQLSKEHLEESTEQGSCIKAESKPWEDPIESDLAAAESDNPAVPERELANESENLIQDSPQSDTQRWKLIPLPFKQ